MLPQFLVADVVRPVNLENPSEAGVDGHTMSDNNGTQDVLFCFVENHLVVSFMAFDTFYTTFL